MNKQYYARYIITLDSKKYEGDDEENFFFFSSLSDLEEQIEDRYFVSDIDTYKDSNRIVFSWYIDEDGNQYDDELSLEKRLVKIIILDVYKLSKVNFLDI